MKAKILIIIVALILVSVTVVLGAISPASNLNGYNRYTIKDYANISGTYLNGNLSYSYVVDRPTACTGDEFLKDFSGTCQAFNTSIPLTYAKLDGGNEITGTQSITGNTNFTGNFQIRSWHDNGTVLYVGNNSLGSNDRVGINTPFPKAHGLHIWTDNSGLAEGSYPTSANLIIEDDYIPIMNFLSNSTGTPHINFGDNDDNDRARFYYDHADDTFHYDLVSTPRLLIDMINGRLGVNTDNPQGNGIHVYTGSSTSAGFVDSAGIILEDDATATLSFMTENTGTNYIFFGDNNDVDRGRIYYSHSDDTLHFNLANTDKMVLDMLNNNLLVSTSIIPTANDTYSLGNSTNYFSDLYVGSSTIHICESAGNCIPLERSDDKLYYNDKEIVLGSLKEYPVTVKDSEPITITEKIIDFVLANEDTVGDYLCPDDERKFRCTGNNKHADPLSGTGKTCYITIDGEDTYRRCASAWEIQ